MEQQIRQAPHLQIFCSFIIHHTLRRLKERNSVFTNFLFVAIKLIRGKGLTYAPRCGLIICVSKFSFSKLTVLTAGLVFLNLRPASRGGAEKKEKNSKLEQCVVQKELPISGHGAIDIVYGQYFTPSGVVIQDNGIKPDIEVDLPEGVSNSNYIERDKDTQLQRAIENVTK